MTKKQVRLSVPSHAGKNSIIGTVTPNSSLSLEDSIRKAAEIEAANASNRGRQNVRDKVKPDELFDVATDFVEDYENYIKNKVRDASTISDLKDIIVEMAGDMAELSRKKNGINSP